ncbi:hypothetical protein NC652_004621 [Populus alba x Populus x berolinensis]|nr:hypothetical protein NC652_004621 [Populus alba x Populus x berolinensis]
MRRRSFDNYALEPLTPFSRSLLIFILHSCKKQSNCPCLVKSLGLPPTMKRLRRLQKEQIAQSESSEEGRVLGEWDLSGFVDLILEQTTVGTVVNIEDDEDNGLFSVVSALNLGRYKDHKCIAGLKEYLLQTMPGEKHKKEI